MSPQDLQAELDQAAQEFAAQIASQVGDSTGVPKPPTIEVSVSELPPEVFNFELDPQTEAQSLPGGGGSSPPPVVCSHNPGDATITLAGFSLCGGCFFPGSGSGPASINNLIELVSINGTFTVPRVVTGPPYDEWLGNSGVNNLSWDQWNTDPSCTGPPDATGALGTLTFLIYCGAGGAFSDQLFVAVYCGPGLLFLASGVTSLSSASDGHVCYELVIDPTFGQLAFVAAGGTVTLVIP